MKHGEVQMDPLKFCKIIMACALLHNICKMRNIEIPPHPEDNNIDLGIDANPNLLDSHAQAGLQYRDCFAGIHFHSSRQRVSQKTAVTMGDSEEVDLTHISVDHFMREETWQNAFHTVQDPYPAPWSDNRACLHRIIRFARGERREKNTKGNHLCPFAIDTVLAGVTVTPSSASPQSLLSSSGRMEKEDNKTADEILDWSELTFVLGEKLLLVGTEEHHFLSVPDVTQLRVNTVLTAVVGLLNSGRRGAAYLGVGQENCVEGIICPDHLISTFIQGLVNTLRDTILPYPSCGVRAHRAVSSKRVVDAWVVEIKTVPRANTYYSTATHPDYHHCHQGVVHSLPFPGFCHEVVARAALPYQRELETLREKIKRIKELLEGQHDDIVEEPHVCPLYWSVDCPSREQSELFQMSGRRRGQRLQGRTPSY
ncbi:uncharacterized protein LOC135114998 isoform X3 [Scylla paramamosain]